MDNTPESPGGRRLTLAEVGDELSVSVSQVYALVRTGELVGIQIGGRGQWRVERVKLVEYIAEAYRRAAASLAELSSELPSDAT
ncbi:DNA binding domain-containing protein, excisionase family [Nakamurella panacisegetis]|uniref:DNA binding domain-containing protein, excisionase family n=1 Tax=Nakamurella panacisegetis TaxID=1090615 RepID=A0A1H0RWF0_9ACTN|nr:helix-turn-helix domain-containing protein [Nakamurella panacisegetis]SDP33727.1 DNA binding domain-containing protein, excisionase family [Nakamurella panacisegetis]